MKGKSGLRPKYDSGEKIDKIALKSAAFMKFSILSIILVRLPIFRIFDREVNDKNAKNLEIRRT